MEEWLACFLRKTFLFFILVSVSPSPRCHVRRQASNSGKQVHEGGWVQSGQTGDMKGGVDPKSRVVRPASRSERVEEEGVEPRDETGPAPKDELHHSPQVKSKKTGS